MASENRDLCMSYLERCKRHGKMLTGFSEMLIMLQDVVSDSGLTLDELKLVVSVITKLTLNSAQCCALIKCLIPVDKMDESIIEAIGIWFVSMAKSIPVMPAIATFHWLIGLIDYGLVDIKTVNIFYDAFFYILVKHQKLEAYVARLIYMLTKPEDVSRRQVSRVLILQAQYTKPPKHLIALLSLFKSYKPEHVPEKIPSTNIESAWKRIPESLGLDLQGAAKRLSSAEQLTSWQQNIVWNPVTGAAKSARKQHSLLPVVGYVNIGSSISREKDSKSVFEISNLDELGKHQLSIELPCNALSLLVNNAGLHILAFASADYQSRFCYNLYSTLQNAFIYEVGKFTYAERDRLLSMTVQLSGYVQQEIGLVGRFLQNYLPFWNTRDYRESILALIEWITFPSYADVHNNILVPLRTMWESSSVNVKCQILRTVRGMVTNLFVKLGFEESRTQEPALFLGDSQDLDLAQIMEPLMEFVKNLIVSGLYVESEETILLSEALGFYKQVATLEERSDLLLWTIAPPAVIYAGLTSKSIATLSRVCSLLLKYRDINAKLKEMRCRDRFEAKLRTLDTYGTDLAKALCYNEVFSGAKDTYFCRFLPDSVLIDLKRSCASDTALNISNHYAVLPYKFTLIGFGLTIKTTEDCMSVAEAYYPEVAKFLKVFKE